MSSNATTGTADLQNQPPLTVEPMFDAATLRFRRAQFSERMVMIKHLTETAEGDEVEYFYRNLLQSVEYLARRRGVKSAK